MNKSTINKAAQSAQPHAPSGAADNTYQRLAMAIYCQLIGGQTGRVLASLDDSERLIRYMDEASVAAQRAARHLIDTFLTRH